MKRSRVLVLSLILVVALVLAACGGNTDKRYEYKGEMDEHGWAVEAWIDVEDGKIVDSFFDYVNEDGNYKSEDQAYIQSMKENSDVGADISVIINYLEDYLKNNTDVSGIDADAVSGATSTVNNFKIAAEKLYKDAGLAD
ncbi:MAG: FMN-binding protein [Eubacteriales bacterium]|nr:FMN-binding protein [Eubacteriales bacterium]MDD4540676.1 FMN-binding protein [Eubacteriales bacterium]